MKKRLIIASAATIVGLASASGAAFAATQNSNSTNPEDSLVSKLATRFNLDKNEVQKVFDETKTEREQQRQADVKAKLDQAVKDNKLTQAQADELMTKLKAMDTLRDSLKDKTPQERRDAMKVKMDELKKWLDDNKLSMKDLGIGHGFGGRMHGPDGMMRGDMKDDTAKLSDDNQG